MEFFQNLDPLLQAYWYIAIPVSLIFIIQMILTVIGIEADDLDVDFDVPDHDAEGFQLFSFRNLVNFLLGLSWTGIAFYTTISNTFVLMGLSVLVGILFVLMFFFIIRQIQRLAEDNTFNIVHTIGKTAQVYLSVPAARQGKGKVQVSVNGTLHELQAVTDGDALPTGAIVMVKDVLDGHLLVVAKA